MKKVKHLKSRSIMTEKKVHDAPVAMLSSEIYDPTAHIMKPLHQLDLSKTPKHKTGEQVGTDFVRWAKKDLMGQGIPKRMSVAPLTSRE